MTFLIAIIGFCGTNLSAENTGVAKVGNTEYATIDEAIAAWTNNTTLTLLADVTLSDVIQLSSTEYHILDLGSYTMTAASKKDAIQIVNNGRSSASYALDIKADATNPGGITATGKAVVRTTGKSGVKDRPIIRFYNGVFNSSYIVYHSGSNGTNCPQFQFHGGVFNGTIYTNRTLNQFYGGIFNGSLMMSVDSSAYTLIAGGTFKQLSNSYMSALNSSKFTIGSTKGVYDREVYIDDSGNYVIAAAEPSEGIEADVAKTPGTNDYLAYSKVATEGQLGYTDVYTAINNNKSGTITVYKEELDLNNTGFTGTIVVPADRTITITNAPEGLKVTDVEGNTITPNANGTYTTVEPAGNNFTGYTGEDAIWGEVWGNAYESFVIKVLDANGNVMGTTSLNNIGGIIDGDVNVTWNLKLNAASNTDEYWTMSWTTAPTIDNMPAKVELWVDGVKVSGGNVVLNGPDNLNMIYAAVTDADGKIYSYHTSIADAVAAITNTRSNPQGYIALLRNTDEAITLPAGIELKLNGFEANNIVIPVASVNGTSYTDLQDAIVAAAPAGTVEILADVVVDEWIMFSETLNISSGQIITMNIDGLTINGNGKTVTIKSIESAGNGGYLIFDATNLNVKDLTINYADGLVGGIGLTNGTISNVTFIGGTYGVFPGAGNVTVTGCTFNTNGTAIYFEQERDDLVVTDNTFELSNETNVILLRGDVTFTGNNVKSGRTVNVVSGSPVVSGNDFNGVRFKVYNAATATIEDNEINVLAFNDESVVFSTFGENTLSTEAQDVLDAASFPVAQIGTTKYATLAEAVAAVQEGQTIQLLAGEISEGTIKLPATLKNVTFKGAADHASVLKDMTIMAADGNSFNYEGLTFDGIYFNNSRISLTGWRNGDETIKDLTVTNCWFKNLDDTSNSAPLHINKDASEAVNGLTFTNNVIDGATGGDKSGVYAQTTGVVVFTGNIINNVSFCPYIIQLTTDDGVADNFTVTGNKFSGSAAGRAQGLGNNAEGTDAVSLTISNNIFEDITNAQQICYWNFNEAKTTAVLEKNYYDIDIEENPNRIYFNSAAQDAYDLLDMGIFPIYKELNADGTINTESEYTPNIPFAQIGETGYPSLEAAAAAAQPGDEILLLANVTLSEELTTPAGITLNGNGKQINGSIVAGGDLTIKGHTKATSFNAGYNQPIITIGAGACLEMNGADRMVIGHGATFNITGNITDAKNANVADLTPSLIMPGASFTGAGVTFNVTNAYINAPSSYCSSSKSASGTFVFKFDNSIWESAGKLAFESQSTAATVNFELKDSKLTTGSHLVFGVSRGEVVFDNSNVNVGTSRQIENQSTMTVKNGSVVNGAVATSSNAKNPGTLIVDNATYAVTGEFSGSDLGTGTLIVNKTANFSATSITKANIQIDATGMIVGDVVNITANLNNHTGTIEVINDNMLDAKIDDGKIVIVERTLQGEGTEASPYVINNLEDLKFFRDDVNAGNNYAGKYIKVTATEIDLNNEEWTPIAYMGKTFKGNFDGNNVTVKNLKITKALTNSAENNGIGFFGRTDSPATIENIIIENVDITGSLYVGAIVGYGYTDKHVEGCTVKGNIAIDAWWYAGVIGGNGYMNLVDDCHVIGNNGSYIKGNDGSYIGGIWGFRGEGNNKITNCTVTNLNIIGVDRVGGICGIGHYGNTISGCDAEDVTVTATDPDATTIGLLVGATQGNDISGQGPTIFEDNDASGITAQIDNGDGTYTEVTNLYGTNINGSTPVTNYVAQIVGGTQYATLAEAVAAAVNNDVITLLPTNAPIAMNASLYGKNVTITGTATVDWSKGFLFVGRGGEGNAKLTFESANLTSASNSSSYGIHVSGREKNTNNKYDGTLVINNSTIDLDYLINRGTIELDGGNLTVKNGFGIAGRPGTETESGEDATATITLNNESKVVVNNHNGMGLGIAATQLEGFGIMNINSGSTFECTQSFLVTAKGTMNVNGGNVKVYGTLTNNGEVNVNEGENTLNITTLEGKEIKLQHGATLVDTNVGGEAMLYGAVTFKGDNTFTMIYDYGAAYSTESAAWTVEPGASLTLTATVRYGLGYGDNATIKGNITDALTARGTLTDDDLSFFTHGISMMCNWNEENYLTVNDAYVQIGSNNSFGTKNDYGQKGKFYVNFTNSVLTSSRVTIVENGGFAYFTFNGSDVLTGGWSQKHAGSTAEFTNSKMVVTGNGTDYNNANAGMMTIVGSNIEFESGAFTNTGTLNIGEKSTFTAPTVINNGTINFTAPSAKLVAQEGLAINLALDNPEYYEIEYADRTYSVKQVIFEQTQTLSSGWNWFSSYINLNSNEGLETLQNALGTNGIEIKSHYDGYVRYESAYELWWGNLSAVAADQMYMIRTSTQVDDMKLVGEMVDYNNVSITLKPGWNWIGFPMSEAVSVTDALAGFEAKPGDQIKSKVSGNASYDADIWYGGLNTLVPGEGYMYYNSSSEARSFTYNVGTGTRGELKANVTTDGNHWIPNAGQYPNNMTMTAMVEVEGGDYEVAAFVNGECRGSARPIYIEAMDAHILFLTIHGEDVEEMTFRYYDIATGEEFDLNDRMNYSNDAIVGTIAEPYIFSRGTTGIGEASLSEVNIYPNPTTTGTEINLQATCDKVEVFNALGVKVAEYHNVDSIDAFETAGIYVIRLTSNGDVKHCRLIVK